MIYVDIVLLSFIVLCSKGVAANLLKCGVKRRRSKFEIDQCKLEAQLKEEAQAGKDNRIADLESAIEDQGEKVERYAHHYHCLNEMIDAGVVKEQVNGDITIVQEAR